MQYCVYLLPATRDTGAAFLPLMGNGFRFFLRHLYLAPPLRTTYPPLDSLDHFLHVLAFVVLVLVAAAAVDKRSFLSSSAPVVQVTLVAVQRDASAGLADLVPRQSRHLEPADAAAAPAAAAVRPKQLFGSLAYLKKAPTSFVQQESIYCCGS